MKPEPYLDRLIAGGTFRFRRLDIAGIDNEPVFKLNVPEMVEQETCLFHRDVSSGNQYLEILHATVQKAMAEKAAMPIVRFADGEYAFYRHSLDCNGLYRQAENGAAIRKAMPAHIEAMRALARRGRIAPLVFPGNTRKKEGPLFLPAQVETRRLGDRIPRFSRSERHRADGRQLHPLLRRVRLPGDRALCPAPGRKDGLRRQLGFRRERLPVLVPAVLEHPGSPTCRLPLSTWPPAESRCGEGVLAAPSVEGDFCIVGGVSVRCRSASTSPSASPRSLSTPDTS